LALLLICLWPGRAQALQFVVDYTDGANEGFNDPTLGASRKSAFEAALNQWQGWVTNTRTGENNTVEVNASFDPLGWVNGQGNLLGSTSIPTWRFNGGVALTPAQYMFSSGGSDANNGQADATIAFNSDAPFYLGTDGKCGSSQLDLMSVTLHEFGHVMGMMTTYDPTGSPQWGLWQSASHQYRLSLWDTLLRDETGARPPPGGNAGFDVNGAVTFIGTNAVAANSGAPVGVYTATPYQPGSSLTHIVNGADASLMNYSIGFGQVRHGLWDYEAGIFKDLGWSIANPPATEHTSGRGGDWQNGDAWNGGLPPIAGDTVRLDAPAGWPSAGQYTIQLRDSAAPAGVVITGPGKLSLLQAGNLTTGDITCNGAMETTAATNVVTAATLRLGSGGAGAFTHSAGMVSVSTELVLGELTGDVGTYTLSAGAFTAPVESVGKAGAGTFTQSGGTNTVSDTLWVARAPGATGAYTLSGGTLSAGTIQVNAGGTFTQTGGNLQVGSLTVGSGGSWLGTVGIPGTATVNAGGTVTGGVTVTDSNSRLVANGSIGGAVVLNTAGTLLTGSGTIGSLTSTGGTINPGTVGGAPATLTVGNVSFNTGSLSHLVIDMVGVTTTNGPAPATDELVTGAVTGLSNLSVYIAGMPETPNANFQPGRFANGFTVLHSSGDLRGTTFTAANFDTDYSWWKATPTVSADGHDLIVKVTWATVAGDFTGPTGKPDGVVNSWDLAGLLASWTATSGINYASGDMSGATGDPDGVVNSWDLAQLLASWTTPGVLPPTADDSVLPPGTDDGLVVPPSTGMVAVPEPATMTLLVLGGLALIRRRRR
jgi:hypothetical protein